MYGHIIISCSLCTTPVVALIFPLRNVFYTLVHVYMNLQLAVSTAVEMIMLPIALVADTWTVQASFDN